MDLQEYLDIYYPNNPQWFTEECTKQVHQDRINNILNIKEYLDGNHVILNRPNTLYNGKTFETTKIVLQYAKPIVAFQKSFLLKNPVTLICDDNKTLKEINNVYKQGRLNSIDGKILDKLIKYGIVAEYLYIGYDKNIKSKIILPEDSYPVFTDTGDYVAFIEHYTVASSGISYYTIYYHDRVEEWDNKGNGSNGTFLKKVYKNLSGLPCLYRKLDNEEDATQGRSDLEDYVNIIDRMEDLLSKYHDSFYKFLNPIPVLKGTKLNIDKNGNGAVDKNVVGNVLQIDDGSEFNLVLSKMDNASLKELYNTLMNSLLNISMTPNIAFGGSSNPANLAEESIRMMYTLPVLKASMSIDYLKEGFYSRWEQIERLLQYKDINVKGLMDCSFELSIPQNETELVNNVVALYTNKLISKQSAIAQEPYVHDVGQEIELLNKEDNNNNNNDNNNNDNNDKGTSGKTSKDGIDINNNNK